jgi:Heavy-metal resistance
MTNEDRELSDRELDTLLAHASTPPVPLGAKSRLMTKAHAQTAFVAGEARLAHSHSYSRLAWLSGLPLAASLALGIYLGAGGGLLSAQAQDFLVGVSSDDPVTGIERGGLVMTDSRPDTTTPSRASWLPQLQSRWWTLLLVLSLMLNLLVVGLAIGIGLGGGPVDRIMGSSYIQLVPRNFLRELPRERRHELMAIVRERSKALRELRNNTHIAPLKLADALEKPGATDADIKAAIDAFTTGSESLAAGGGAVVVEIVAKLTPEERKMLAAAIRERAERAQRKSSR